jgi:RNA polymerase sigma-70 factor (ECF subfamily)
MEMISLVAIDTTPPAAGLRVAGASRGRVECVEYGSLTDEQLLGRVADHRDSDAFTELYGRYARAVFSLVARTIRDRDAGEDIAQEAFTAVWRAARSYKPERGSAVAWMFTIARNAAVDAARARRPVVFGDPPDSPDPAPTPDVQVSDSMDAFRVHAAVDSLPEREREVIAMAYFEGLSQSEVAEKLHVPLGTVKTRTRSGLARLAERLDREQVVLG